MRMATFYNVTLRAMAGGESGISEALRRLSVANLEVHQHSGEDFEPPTSR
jgi:hypothetical protein